MNERTRLLATNMTTIADARTRQRARSLARDRTLQQLVADLIAARTAAGISQEELAARMFTTKSAISRLEAARTCPTLRTIEHYAVAVGARVQLRVRR